MVANVGIASEFELSEAASGMVVSLDDLKDHLRYLSDDQNSLISALHDAAVARIESETRRQLLTATWKLYLPDFPTVIPVRKCPVASIESITYLDVNGVTQTLSSAVYESFLTREPAEIRLAYDQSYPAIRSHEQAICVTFTAGYGVGADCPAQAHHLVKLIVEDLFTSSLRNEKTIQRLMSHLQWGM